MRLFSEKIIEFIDYFIEKRVSRFDEITDFEIKKQTKSSIKNLAIAIAIIIENWEPKDIPD
jgi:hypothetical protein